MYYTADSGRKKESRRMRQIKVAAIQMQCSKNPERKQKKRQKEMIRKAAGDGANIILLPELFEREYFCQQRRYDFYHYAKSVEENEAVLMGQRLAKELGVVLPISFYEKKSIICTIPLHVLMPMERFLVFIGKHIFQMTIIIRKNFILHLEIPDFVVFQTRFGTIGVGICWDQWFPETARSMALLGQNFYFIRLQLVRNRFWNVTVCRIGDDVCRDIQPQILCR